MSEEELKLTYRFVVAVEAIAAAMTATPVDASTPKRPPGRPRKTAEPTVEVEVETAKPVETKPAKPEPTEDERKLAFAELRASLQNCLALHGEEVTRERLKHPKFSEVPFDDIEATIARLDA